MDDVTLGGAAGILAGNPLSLRNDRDTLDKTLRISRLRHRQDCVWGVTLDNRIVGTVSLVHEDRHVVRINAFRIDPDWQQTAVLAKLIDHVHGHCWDQGCLKVILEARAAPALARNMFEHRGFHLVRRRQASGKELLEYYVDLYYGPVQK